MKRKEIAFKNKKVVLHWNSDAKTLVYFIDDREDPKRLFDLSNDPFSFAVITGVDWDDELTPFAGDGIFRKGRPFGGHLFRFENEFEEEIFPLIEQELPSKIENRILAGYSLAGLFAFDMGMKSKRFNHLVCCSGSFWFPGYLESLKEIVLPEQIHSLYFSIGEEEGNTKNPYLAKSVSSIHEVYEKVKNQVPTQFVLEKGNHFNDPDGRLMRGLEWAIHH